MSTPMVTPPSIAADLHAEGDLEQRSTSRWINAWGSRHPQQDDWWRSSSRGQGSWHLPVQYFYLQKGKPMATLTAAASANDHQSQQWFWSRSDSNTYVAVNALAVSLYRAIPSGV